MSSRNPRETRYKGVAFRSRLEAEYAIELDRRYDFEWEYEPCRYMNSDRVTYLPDFRITTDTGSRFYAEIKPDNANFDAALNLMHVILDEEPDVGLFVETATWRNGSECGYERWRMAGKCLKDDPCGSRDCPRGPKRPTVVPPSKRASTLSNLERKTVLPPAKPTLAPTRPSGAKLAIEALRRPGDRSVCPSCNRSLSGNNQPHPHLCDSCWKDEYELCWACMEQGVRRDRADADPWCGICRLKQAFRA